MSPFGLSGTSDITSLRAPANSPTAPIAEETTSIPLAVLALAPIDEAIAMIGLITIGRLAAICAEIPAITFITTGKAASVDLRSPPFGIAIFMVSIIALANLLTESIAIPTTLIVGSTAAASKP